MWIRTIWLQNIKYNKTATNSYFYHYCHNVCTVLFGKTHKIQCQTKFYSICMLSTSVNSNSQTDFSKSSVLTSCQIECKILILKWKTLSKIYTSTNIHANKINIPSFSCSSNFEKCHSCVAPPIFISRKPIILRNVWILQFCVNIDHLDTDCVFAIATHSIVHVPNVNGI